MKLSDLKKIIFQGHIPTTLNEDEQLKIETDPEKCTGKSALFIYRGVEEAAYTVQRSVKTAPYVIICDEDIVIKDTTAPIIKVENARRALTYALYKEHDLENKKMSIIGVTGTNGKSSTAEILFTIFRTAGQKAGLIGTGVIKVDDEIISSEHYSMTTPDPVSLYKTLSMMHEVGCSVVIMEVSSHAIALGKTFPILFDCCLFTNLSPEHMDLHGTMESYYLTKLSLFNQTKIGVFNLDDPYSAKAYRDAKCDKYSVGIIDEGDAFITDYKDLGYDGSSFFYREKGLIFKLELKLCGSFNVYNALMAAKAAIALGVKPTIVKKAIRSLRSVCGRMELIPEEVNVIIDYAHTPFAMENALKTLKTAKKLGQNLLTVFGCGGDRDRTKRGEMARIAAKYSDKIIITEDNSRSESTESIMKDITLGLGSFDNVELIPSREEAISHAVLTANDGDIIALLGKGHEKYIIRSNAYEKFDERAIVYDALAERRRRNENKAWSAN